MSSLIVRYFHVHVAHQGKEITLHEVQANGYWIIGRVSAVNSAIGFCLSVPNSAPQ